jgi:hypothetical protein
LQHQDFIRISSPDSKRKTGALNANQWLNEITPARQAIVYRREICPGIMTSRDRVLIPWADKAARKYPHLFHCRLLPNPFEKSKFDVRGGKIK